MLLRVYNLKKKKFHTSQWSVIFLKHHSIIVFLSGL